MIPRYWGWSKHGIAEPSNLFRASVVLRLSGGLQHVTVPSKMFFFIWFFFLLRMGSKSSEVVVAWSVAKACLWRECFRAGTCGASVLTFQGRWA